ncbi:uncharacterized protein F4812DRAFT_417465 [Daldinia caldariorum]|uniref:uncharacterized protein n=1 Tax=Daldinia caldariorum TaxID=326644 RepID=UPI002007C9EC|nr:uncharacterized protein F4812DRAFT_417465 [Daldinia caldariorum]KAI1470423.1 hypothetical protein F4812DRAFT_417465 [Daldinia caldariorum]
MCHHRKTIYKCNHTDVDPPALRACETQHNHETGLSSEPCNVIERWSNVKVPRLCPSCRETKSHGKCVSHMDEAGLKTEERQDDNASPESKEMAAAEPESAGIAPGEPTQTVDPVEEFLRKKKEENDAHLMMISDYR